MNTIKSYNEFLLLEMKTEKEIVQDLARHLAFDRDVIKYLNTSRSKRKIGWRELLDYKLRGKQKDYINYITKNMVADYNPRITGYIKIDDGEDEDFDSRVAKRNRDFADMDIEKQIDDLNQRTNNIEQRLGIDPNDKESLERVDKALKDAGYVRPEIKEDEEDEKEDVKEDIEDIDEEE